jgi:hypothetical protein
MTLTLGLLLALLVALAAAGLGHVLGERSARRKRRQPLPREWDLMARPVLNGEERRAMRLLREALPQYTVLAKLPLVRLCQPRDPQRGRYWYELLGPLLVSFVVCSANGRVLAAVDLQPERGMSARAAIIKQSVMDACRIRYLSCRAENLPPASELQLLVPVQGLAPRPAPLTPPAFQRARSSLSDTVRTRRAERTQLWGDSAFGADSFFAPDSRLDTGPPSEFAASTFAPSSFPPSGFGPSSFEPSGFGPSNFGREAAIEAELAAARRRRSRR